MYEEQTFESIMDEMMEDMPDDIDTNEGSLIYNACAKHAARLEEAYIELSTICDNQYPDTADLEHLILFGQEIGVYIEEATCGTFKGRFNISIEIGERFSGDDFDYIVIEVLDEETHEYLLECEEQGEEPNRWLGELDSIEPLDGLETAELTELVTPGKEEEDEESYRIRLLDYFGIKPFAGNRKYYEEEMKEIEGVGAVKLRRREGAQIEITILNEVFRSPTDEAISDIQEKVDPLQNQGEGLGIAPIGHAVTISGAIEQIVNIEVNIIYDEGYSFESLKSILLAKIEEYFATLRQTWETTDKIIVRRSRIETAIVDVEGVIDVENLLLNGKQENITLEENIIPVIGGFNAK